MRTEPLDAVVVGAGPAGASAAYHLASCGRRVLLLEQHLLPRAKTCGDGLGSDAMRLLSEMGVLAELPPHQRTRGLRVHMRNRGCRTFSYSDEAQFGYGAVVNRAELDAALCARAVEAGAELWPNTYVQRLMYSALGVCGVEAVRDGELRQLRAHVVIAADGAATELGRQAGLGKDDHWAGFGYQTYVGGLDNLDDYLEIHLPLFDVTDRYLLPSYGWVFPVGPTTANIGVGLFDPAAIDDAPVLLDRFLDNLGRHEPRFAAARPLQKPRGAPLRLDFDPARCGAPGLLLVGDAAGMASPFTGEGISFALESGKLAARHVDVSLGTSVDRPHEPDSYIAALSARYGTYSEASAHSMRRYLLAWHVLESTFDDERPLFDLCRRAALFPESLRADTLLDPMPVPPPEVARRLRLDFPAVAEILVGSVRTNWPMFVRMSVRDTDSSAPVLRPAVLLLLASYVGGERHELTTALAAAVEMGFLAGIAFGGATDEDPANDHDSRVPWGNRFAVMVGDFLLSHAYELCALGGTDVIASFADAFGAACEGQIRELRSTGLAHVDESEHVDVITQNMTTAFELPCLLGARLGGASSSVAAALTEYGRHLGVAYALIDEVREINGTGSLLAPSTTRGMRSGRLGLPALRAAQRQRVAADIRATLRNAKGTNVVPLADTLRGSEVLDEVIAIATTYAQRACRALDDVPSGAPRDFLADLARHVASRR